MGMAQLPSHSNNFHSSYILFSSKPRKIHPLSYLSKQTYTFCTISFKVKGMPFNCRTDSCVN